MYKNSIIHFFFLGMLFFSTSFLTIHAQPSDFFMEFRGKAIYENNALPGAKVIVYKHQICKYCNKEIIWDAIASEYIAYFMFDECLSDEEKIIKDLLE